MANRGGKEVLWAGGENVGQLDLNNMSRFARAQAIDWGFAALGQTMRHRTSSFDRKAFCYAVSDACGPWAHALTNNRVRTNGGPIFAWKSSAPPPLGLTSTGPTTSPPALTAFPTDWGEDPYALAYYADADEFATTHDVGDATNPRFDVVSLSFAIVDNDPVDDEVRLQKQLVLGNYVISSATFHKRRKVVVTKTVTKGTPSATPAVPTIPAGNVALYVLYVPATFNTLIDPEQIWDCRMPLGNFCVDVLSRDMLALSSGSNLGSAVPQGGNFGGVTAGNASLSLNHFVMGHSQNSARLLGVAAIVGAGVNVGPSTFVLKRLTTASADPTGTNISLAPGKPMTPAGFALAGAAAANQGNFNHAWLDHDIFTGVAADLTRLPVWINGTAGGYAMDVLEQAVYDGGVYDNTFSRLSLSWGAGDSTAVCRVIRFWFAGGPF